MREGVTLAAMSASHKAVKCLIGFILGCACPGA
jgi:hypothetical protein